MDELKRLVELISNALGDLEKLRGAEATFRATDAPDIKRLRLAVNALLEQLDQIGDSLHGELAEAADIAKRVVDQGPGQPATGAVTATDFAKGFRSVIETMQREAGEGAVGDVGTIIKSMDVELKGLVVVEDSQPKVVPPSPGSTVDPNTLSTIRMSFASVPIQRTAGPKSGPG